MTKNTYIIRFVSVSGDIMCVFERKIRCTSTMVSLNSSGSGGISPYTYIWDNGIGTNSTVTTNPAITTTYTFTVTDACGASASDDVVVNIGSGYADAGNDTAICPGSTATLFASGGNSFQWNNGVTTALNTVSPLQTTMYFVTVTNICDGYDSVLVTVKPLPTIIATSSMDSICKGNEAILNVSGGDSFYWSSSPNDPSLLGQETSMNPVVSPMQTTMYFVTGTDSYSCSNTDTVIVKIYPGPTAGFSAFNTDGCVPNTVSFFDNSQGVNFATQYLWQFGDGNTSGMPNPTYTYVNQGTYDVTLIVTDGGICSDTLTYQSLVNVYPLPDADFVIEPSVVSIFDPVVAFYDRSVGYPPPVQWLWSQENGDASIQQNYFYTYADTGIFNVTLTVWNHYGCLDSSIKEVIVRPDYTIFIPTGFSPNNDSYNDVFKAFGVGLLAFNMKIFTRWGNLIYNSNDLTAGWNGKINNFKALPGVYTYVINYTDALKQEHVVYGYVTLLR